MGNNKAAVWFVTGKRTRARVLLTVPTPGTVADLEEMKIRLKQRYGSVSYLGMVDGIANCSALEEREATLVL